MLLYTGLAWEGCVRVESILSSDPLHSQF